MNKSHQDENSALEQVDAIDDTSTDDLFNLKSKWSHLSKEKKVEQFSHLNRTDAEELFLSQAASEQVILIENMTLLEKRSWVRLLAPDDAADLIQELDPEHKEEILSLLDPQTRREVSVLLAYAEDNAGGLMSSRFVRLRPEMSVDEAISYLRIQSKTHVEMIYYAYVLDSDQKLLGIVSFRELFTNAPSRKISDIMSTDVIKIPVNLDQEEIGRIFSQHEYMALPVINPEGKMEGIVTFDDIASAIQQEATEDIHKLGGMESIDAPYFQISFLEMIKKRGGWLLILFLGELMTTSAMSHFQSELERSIVLSLFIPLIISSGGNSGSQATTLIIRAMALKEVILKDWLRVFTKEAMTGVALGLFLGFWGFVRILIWPGKETLFGANYIMIGFTVAFALVGIVLWGTIVGAMLPFIFKRFKLDPASASAPAVATIVDVSGLVLYFTIAQVFLNIAI